MNGFYAHPDPAICNVFYACVDGKPEEYVCSPGLWFDEYKGVCNWPAETDRQNCQAGRLSGKSYDHNEAAWNGLANFRGLGRVWALSFGLRLNSGLQICLHAPSVLEVIP